MELLAVTFNDDPTAQGDVNMVHNVASDILFVGDMPISAPATLTVTASIHSSGNTLVLARGAGTPTGIGLIRYTLGLSLAVLKLNGDVGGVAQPEVIALCRLAAPAPFGYNEGVQEFAFDKDLTASVPVSTGDLAGIGLQAELYVGVSSNSNLYVDGNLSSLQSFFQGPGFISVPHVNVAIS